MGCEEMDDSFNCLGRVDSSVVEMATERRVVRMERGTPSGEKMSVLLVADLRRERVVGDPELRG